MILLTGDELKFLYYQKKYFDNYLVIAKVKNIRRQTMAVKTSNAYGNITIDDEAIACATGHLARECYGVVDLVGQGSVKSKNQLTKGIKIITVGNRIYIDLFAILKYGVSIGTVTDNLKSAVKYGVEQFTGMIVDSVNINVVGVRV